MSSGTSGERPANETGVADHLRTMRVYDPAIDGFPYSRLLLVAANLASISGKASAQYAYGAWNPDCMARDETDEAIRFLTEIEETVSHYKRQALAAKAAQEVAA